MTAGSQAAGKHAGSPGPEPAGVWGRFWFRVSMPFVDGWRRGRARWLLARGERKVRRWRRPRTWTVNALYTVLSAAYLANLVYLLLPGHKDWLRSSGWEQALATLGLSATAVIAAVWFVMWRFTWARHHYLKRAKRHPDELVKPGTVIGEVVGRDRLCNALINALRDRGQRRPHVIVGSIGVGKTALLVHMTERLAEKGITPVVLQLRDEEGIDFVALAKKKFCEEVQPWVLSPAEADKVWQRLRYGQDHVVVLADGLEDALKGVEDRDARIRKAIADAQEAKLPLVVTSRPQKSLRAVNAARTVLEPLSEEDALGYVSKGGNWRTDRQRMDWVVEAADVAESPLYLNIAKDLELRGLLERIVGAGEDDYCDPRDQDVWALRYDLLDAWVNALVDGHLYPEQPLSHHGRRMTVEHLSALACAALRTNSTFVRYDVLAPSAGPGSDGSGGTEDRRRATVRAALLESLGKHKEHVRKKSDIDARLAGSWGSRLGLVEERNDGVRFHHSVLQAFLASRYMDALVREAPARMPAAALAAARPHSALRVLEAMSRPAHESAGSVKDAYFRTALLRPGRELGMALVFYSRSKEALTGCHAHPGSPVPTTDGDCPIGTVRSLLTEAAGKALDTAGSGTADGGAGADTGAADSDDVVQDSRIRALEMYSTALDVDSFHHDPAHREIVKELRDRWDKVQVYNDRTLDAPKKALIKRIGATGWLLSRRRTLPPGDAKAVKAPNAYDVLFEIARKEPSHEVRFAIAEAIGEGGDAAYRELERDLPPTAVEHRAPRDGERPSPYGTPDEVTVDLLRILGMDVPDELPGSPPPSATGWEGPTAAPGTTRTERLLRKTRTEILDHQRDEEEVLEQREREKQEQGWRADIMRAWLAPMLVQSCSSTRHERTPYELVSRWMERVAGHKVELGLQVALAQGFRRAANHRTPPNRPATKRDFLNEQAWEMLKHTRYWYVRLALVQALTLWALPDDVARRRPRHGHGASPARQIRRWLRKKDPSDPRSAVRHEHPLVKAAGKMARRTLQTRRPDRFLWIDENGTASQIGSETSSPRQPRLHNLWIPPSRGWSTLDPGAQQLLADVLVLLTLTEERGDRPDDARSRLTRADRTERPLLPPCLARDRAPLDPAQALVTEASRSLPGSNCADGCPFEMCPYPPKGPQCRTELNELFCIQQRSMLNRQQFQAWRFLRFRRRAPWQGRVSVANLRRFWDDMGARARDQSVVEASRGRVDRR